MVKKRSNKKYNSYHPEYGYGRVIGMDKSTAHYWLYETEDGDIVALQTLTLVYPRMTW